MESTVRSFIKTAFLILLAFFAFASLSFVSNAATVDLVVNIASDRLTYKSFDIEHFTVTVSNNGPDPATTVVLTVSHTLADSPFEASATCTPAGGAVCPPGSDTPPSAAFKRSGKSFRVNLPLIPPQGQVLIRFDNTPACVDGYSLQSPGALCLFPEGNAAISAAASSGDLDVNPQSNSALTNLGLYRPSIDYHIVSISAPDKVSPGSIGEYEFELRSTGEDPTNLLVPTIGVQGPPGSALVSVVCTSMEIGSYPVESVFPVSRLPGMDCPTTGVVPINHSLYNYYLYGGSALAPGTFLSNLPGTRDVPGGGRMRFKARVRAGSAGCTPGYDVARPYLFVSGSVRGLPTSLPSSHANASSDIVGDCKEADIAVVTSASSPTINLEPTGAATWTHTVRISNLSTGSAATAATNVEFGFERQQKYVAESHGPLLCESTPAGLCPSADALAAATVLDNPGAFLAMGTLSAIPPLGSVTLSQEVRAIRNGCMTTTAAAQTIRVFGDARPSRVVADPNYSNAHISTRPSDGPLAAGAYWGNNGQQIAVAIDGLKRCPEGHYKAPTLLSVATSGPFASISAAENGSPPYTNSDGSNFVPGATKVWFKIVVTNTGDTPLPIGDLADIASSSDFWDNPSPIFIPGGPTLADRGISCTPSPATAPCHQLATTISGTYTRTLTLRYDPLAHGGRSTAELAPNATLTYIVPFTTLERTDGCARSFMGNTATVAYLDPVYGSINAEDTRGIQLGFRPCIDGLTIETRIVKAVELSPYGAFSLGGLLTYEVTVTNFPGAWVELLDVPHLTSSVTAPGASLSMVSVVCTVASGDAKCPATPIIAGTRTTAAGVQSPLLQPTDIDHEWGTIGANTMWPFSSLKFTITVKLSDPQPAFTGVQVRATIEGKNDQFVWAPVTTVDSTIAPPVPGSPPVTIWKSASFVAVGLDTFVEYRVILANLSRRAADKALFYDALPANLVASNSQGYRNFACSDISSESFVPAPKGRVVCPLISSDATGLKALIDTFGNNSALLITYRALLPREGGSFANRASVLVPYGGTLTYGSGLAQAQQSVQVSPQAPPAPLVTDAIPVPAIGTRQLLGLILGLLLFGVYGCRRAGRVRHARDAPVLDRHAAAPNRTLA